MDAGPPPAAKDEPPYELPSRQRARLAAKVIITVVVAYLLAMVGKGVWESRRGDRQRKVLAQEWGMDDATFERVSTALGQGTLPDRDVAFEGYLDRHLAAKRARGETVDRTKEEAWLKDRISIRGVPRLGDQDLTDFHALRKRMIFSSDRTCACAWDNSRCSMADMMEGLARLSEEELARFSRLTSRAAILEVQALAPLPSPEAEMQAGLKVILDGLPPPDQERLLRTFDDPKGAPPAEQCFTVRTIFTGAESLDESAYVRFVRAFLTVPALSP